MKNFSSINPIPKRFFNINYQFILMFIYGSIFCTELKAIPEDWPSADGNNYRIGMYEETAQLSCIGSVQVSLDQSGYAKLTAQMLLLDFHATYTQYKVIVNQSSSNVVSCADIGKATIATVIDTTNGMMCWSKIVVEDKLKPEIICRGDTISCTNDPFSVDYSAFVFISDNCDGNVSSYYDITLDYFNCSNNRYSMVVHLKWTAIDDYGNTNSCLQDIYFKKSSIDSIVFPADTIVYCPNADLSLTGVPTLFGDTISYLCQLLATHVDDSIPVCGGMMKIRRLWTVLDWCNSTMKSVTQEILVSDTTKPVILCPRDITLYSDFASCKTDFVIPSFDARDACSPANLLLLIVRLDSSYFLHPGQVASLNIGLHSLNYIAIDPCGNSDTCTSYVLVKDKIAPSLICPPTLIVSLDPRGLVVLTADLIASRGLVTDNCCIDKVQVRRMTVACGRPQDTIFSDKIQFCCEDIHDTLMIVLKATDCSGNMNFCMITIYVQDKNPVATPPCPADITISCSKNYLDLNVTGKYYVITSCLDTVKSSFRDEVNIDSCKNGDVNRTFYLVYPNGTLDSSCKQHIHQVNNYIFNPSHIIWARDTIIPACISHDPKDLRSFPKDSRDTCGSVYFSFVDSQVRFTMDSCEVIDRIWTAYSSCNKQTVKDTQVITLVSLKRSQLIEPRDTTVANGRDSCARFVHLNAAILTGCNRNATITNSFNNGGADASGVYPVGTTNVIYTAIDPCGSIKDTTVVIVLDLENPDITCNVLFINMNPNDSIKLTARELLNSYFDNCTASDKLKLSFSSNNPNDSCKYITCADLQTIPDTFDITVFAEDSSGNIGSCIAKVHVLDPNFYCTTSVRIGDVNGLVKSDKDLPMKGVEIKLEGSNERVETNEDGQYIFKNIITNTAYTISPSYNKNWLQGLTTQDIVKIQRHILGIEPFDHPYQWIAADLDRNGRVTSADIVWLRKLILGKEFSVPSNQSWRFINKAYKFINTTNPLNESFEEKTILKGFWQDTTVHFDAIKVGDVSSIKGVTNSIDRLRKSDVIIENRQFKNGEIFKVDILVEKEIDIEGFQMSFDVDNNGVELYRIQEFINQAEGRNIDQDEYTLNGKQLSLSLIVNSKDAAVDFKGKILSLLFKAKKEGSVRDVFTPGSLISNEMYLKNDVPVKILFTYKELLNDEAELVNWFVDPNPFKDRCYIEFQSMQNEKITFTLFDLTGKSVFSKPMIIVKGKNTLVIDGDDLPGTGTYLYYIGLGDHAYHGKIVKAE